MLKEHAHAIKNLQKVIDVLLTTISFYIAYIFVRGSVLLSNPEIVLLMMVTSVVWWFVLNRNRVYQSRRCLSLDFTLFPIMKSLMVGPIILLLIMYLTHTFLPRSFLFIFVSINAVFLVVEKVIFFYLSSYFRDQGFNTRNTLIVGFPPEAQTLIEKMHSNSSWGLNIIGIVIPDILRPNEFHTDYHINKININNYPVLGNLDDINHIVNNNVIDIIFFAVGPQYIQALEPYLSFCIQRGIHIELSAKFFKELSYVKTSIEQIGDSPYITFQTSNQNPYLLFAKELLDRTAAFIGLVVLSPLFLLISILIKLDSVGPVFFVQQRVGINGRLFNLFKFRSMIVDAEKLKDTLSDQNEMSGPVFKITDDPRVTTIGRILRKTSIDELPQLINVIRGDMSLVGPRPPLPSEVLQYSNWQKRRLSVKPGITCIWQVSGRSNIDFDTWMKMDLEYIDKWSLSIDMGLLLKTIPAVIKQKGAK